MNKLPKKTFVVLWLITISRLLLPYTMPQLINVYPVVDRVSEAAGVNQAVRMPQEIFIQPGMPVITENISDIPRETPQNHGAQEEAAKSIPVIPIYMIIMIIWLMGIIISAASFIIPHIIHSRKYKAALPVENDYINSWSLSHKLRRKYKIMFSDEIISPFTYGIFKPVIVLPEKIDMNNHELLDYILTHEYIHIKRFDIILKWLSAITLCANWFNPLVWVMYILMNRDIELSCDESVVKLKGETNKKSYALTLLDMESDKKSFNPIVNHFNKNSLKERVTAIMQTKKMTLAKIILAFVLIVSSCLILISSCTSDDAEIPDNDNEEESVIAAVETDLNEIELFLPPIIEKSFFERRILSAMMDNTRAFDQINAYYTLREPSVTDFFVPVYIINPDINGREKAILLEYLRTYTDITSNDLFKMYSDYDIPIPVTVDPAYAHVRFGETENILLLEVEWHTPETVVEESIELFKIHIEEMKSSGEYSAEFIRLLEESFLGEIESAPLEISENRLFAARKINGRPDMLNISGGNEPVDITAYYNPDGYFMFEIFPQWVGASYQDENGLEQRELFGAANSQQEYERIIKNEVIPFCDEMFQKGQMTQELYDRNTTVPNFLDLFVEQWFD
jgi:beta-lactamase regulating signal transducer with metallopeptidase domain